MQKKSIIFIFFILILCSSKSYGKELHYLVLGDSIAFGYNLEDINNDSYSQIVRKRLEINESNYKNLSIVGTTCKDYYETIQRDEYSNEIKKADLITISVGSNELLRIAESGIEEVTGVSRKEDNFFGKVQEIFKKSSIGKRFDMAKEIYNYFNSKECNKKIDDNIQIYEEYWNNTIKYIKDINPNATIVVTEFYNPYYGVTLGDYNIGNYAAIPIEKMNYLLWKNSNNEKEYKIAEIYEGFNDNDLKMTNAVINTNVTNFEINMDPHPNKNGHQLIAEKIMEKLLNNFTFNEVNIERTIANQEKKSALVGNNTNMISKILFIASISSSIVFLRELIITKS